MDIELRLDETAGSDEERAGPREPASRARPIGYDDDIVL